MYLYDDYSSWVMPAMESSIIGLSDYTVEAPNCSSRPLLRSSKMTDDGIDQSGYIDIKQAPKVKGKKMKSWKKKWVVVSEMSILPAGRSAAKVDVYADESTAKKSPADKHTFILEFVTEIRAAKSKKHAHAFEVVETDPVLLLAGDTELETQAWMSAFRRIFWPHQLDNDLFIVTIKSNEHSRRLSLEGAYRMSITPEVISIQSDSANSYEWSLHMLKRFHMEKEAADSTVEILTIECGPKSECGEATFHFHSEKVSEILAAIKKNIYIAINKQKSERAGSSSPAEKKWRSSVVSASDSLSDGRVRCGSRTSSEQRFKDLLESPAQEEKRVRLMTNCSEGSMPLSDKLSVTDSIEPSEKRRQSVTFDLAPEQQNKNVDDLLTNSAEILVEEVNDSEYNRVEFTPKKPQQSNTIITTFTIAQPGHRTKVLLDEHGYSHVDIKDTNPHIISEDKSRSLSNISSQSSVSCRSASVGSRDSGIVYSKVDQSKRSKDGTHSNRSTHSFDSAVSTSSTIEQHNSETISSTVSDTQTPTLRIEIEEVHTSNPDELCGTVTSAENGLRQPEQSFYQDLTLDEETHDIQPTLKKSNSTGNVKREENEYEDLDKFRKGRKNLVKHLGMEPGVNPSLVPPALPARPHSHKVKRKYSHTDKRMFTLPFSRNRKKHKDVAPSISSSSESDADSQRDGKTNDMSINVWPLGDKSVIVDNDDLYQPVAIERFLRDNDGGELPQKRERSSSLNLNKTMPFKRPSSNDVAASLERKSAMWKHNRNVSMHVDLIQRHKDANTSILQASANRSFGNDLFDDRFTAGKRGSMLETVHDNSVTSRDDASYSDDEPIYAEVQPLPGTKESSDACAEPFPNLEEWKPAVDVSMCSKDTLNDTVYENGDDSPTKEKMDLFNQGFCSEKNSLSNGAKSDTPLIDFVNDGSDNSNGSAENRVNSAIDIFHLGAYSLMDSKVPLIPMTVSTGNQTAGSNVFSNTSLVPSTSNMLDIFNLGFCNSEARTSKPEMTPQNTSVVPEQESIYMDMSVCKNESIYVMPSTLK